MPTRLDNKAGDAMDAIREAMREDPSYAWSWHCNIAMALHDEMPESFWMPDRSEHHAIANRAASRFMKNAFDVTTYFGMMDEK